jgi:hypothetical protein
MSDGKGELSSSEARQLISSVVSLVSSFAVIKLGRYDQARIATIKPGSLRSSLDRYQPVSSSLLVILVVRMMELGVWVTDRIACHIAHIAASRELDIKSLHCCGWIQYHDNLMHL